jgi:tetratricopeptide (TPR) repeat protein
LFLQQVETTFVKRVPVKMKVLPQSWLLFFVLLSAQALTAATPRQLLASGHVDEAIQVLQQQTSHSPTNAESYNLLCRAYFMIDEWDRGIAACERARSLDPTQSTYDLWLGRIYGEKADHAGFFSAAGLAKKVRSSFERAVELDPRNWEARTDLAEFYLEAPSIVGGGKDKARAQAEALIPLNPGMSHWVLGRIAEKNKDFAAAEREYREEIATSHEGARGWLDLAIFFRHTSRLDEMEQALRRLESAPLDRAESLMDAGGMLLRTGRDFSFAIRLLRRYLSDGPVEEGPAFKAHDLLGQLLAKQGNGPAAAEEFRAALALFHNYARAQEGLKQVTH